MADETSGEVLSIVVDVETKEAKKKLAEWNAELAKATTEAAKREKLLSIASSKTTKTSSKALGAKYTAEMAAIRKEAAKLAKSYDIPAVDKGKRMKEAEKALEAEKKAAEKLWEDRSLDGADKKVWDEKKATVTSYYSEIEKGAKKVKKYLASADEEPELSKETLSKVKGTYIPTDSILGDVISEKKLDDKTVTKTEQIADGLKTVREYAKLANGELYLMSETVTKVKEKAEKVTKPIGSLVESGKILGGVESIKILDDKTVYKTREISDGFLTIREYAKLANGEVYLLSQKLNKLDTEKISEKAIKGTQVEGLLGDVVLQSEEFGKTTIKTQEVANGIKTIREYIKLANGELYLMAERTSKVTEKTKKTKTGFEKIKDDLKNQTKGGSGFFKKIGSIITYRIARTILSAITNAFKQGFSLLSNDNDVVGKVKDQFSSIATTLQVSLTTILIPLFESLANILEPIATDFLNMANAMSLSNAQLKGQSQFFELSKEKIDAYAKSLRLTNKQLSQLDKFATLNGSQAVDLGGYRDVADVTEEETKNLAKYEESISSIKTLLDSLVEIGKALGNVFNFIGEHIDLIGAALLIVLTVTQPLLVALGSFVVLMSKASPVAKALAGVLMTLAGIFIGIGVASAFAKDPLHGAVAGVIAGGVTAVISSIIGSFINSGSAIASTSSFSPSLGGTSIGGSDIYSGIATSTQNGYTAAGGGSVHGNVYMDSKVVGKVVEDSVYAEGTRVGHFGRK